jgi:hypothetical protein
MLMGEKTLEGRSPREQRAFIDLNRWWEWRIPAWRKALKTKESFDRR